MGRSNHRKVYIAVLMLAGAALAGDKLFLGVTNPESAAASEDYVIDVSQWTSESGGASAPALVLSSGIADRMEVLDPSPDATGDAFAQPKAWLVPPAKPVQPSAGAAVEDAGAVFAKRAKLTGLSGSGEKLLAVVNGKKVAVGESIEGFVLVSVDMRAREAVFRNSDGVERTLAFAGASSGNDTARR